MTLKQLITGDTLEFMKPQLIGCSIMKVLKAINIQYQDLIPLLKQMLIVDRTKRITIDNLIAEAQKLILNLSK